MSEFVVATVVIEVMHVMSSPRNVSITLDNSVHFSVTTVFFRIFPFHEWQKDGSLYYDHENQDSLPDLSLVCY